MLRLPVTPPHFEATREPQVGIRRSAFGLTFLRPRQFPRGAVALGVTQAAVQGRKPECQQGLGGGASLLAFADLTLHRTFGCRGIVGGYAGSPFGCVYSCGQEPYLPMSIGKVGHVVGTLWAVGGVPGHARPLAK
jgi:hypothetical protein